MSVYHNLSQPSSSYLISGVWLCLKPKVGTQVLPWAAQLVFMNIVRMYIFHLHYFCLHLRISYISTSNVVLQMLWREGTNECNGISQDIKLRGSFTDYIMMQHAFSCNMITWVGADLWGIRVVVAPPLILSSNYLFIYFLHCCLSILSIYE